MISQHHGLWTVEHPGYRWSWNPETDRLTVSDGQGRSIVQGPLKPRFLFADGAADPSFEAAAVTTEAGPTTLTLRWKAPEAEVNQTWTFEPDHFALGPLRASSPSSDRWARIEELAGWNTHYALLPGLSMSSSLPPVVDLHSKLKLTTTLGAGAMRGPGLAQQWGLPAHWYAVYDTAGRWNAAGARDRESGALCIGLASLPDGDFWVKADDRCVTALLNVRSDLWNLYPAGAPVTTGLDLVFFVDRDLEAAPRAYYRHLAGKGFLAGSAYPAPARPRQVNEWTLFNTWGTQVSEAIQPEQLDQARLERYFAGLEASGMKTRLFVVDDKWEGAYGVLRHDADRFPDFREFLDRVRSKGYGIGLWAAFLRCEDPRRVGLTEEHLMKDHDGQVLWLQHQTARYGIYDITHPEAAAVLTRLAREFMLAYRPDLIKFDFGYELPTLDVSVPYDRNTRGEKLLRRGLEVLLGAMKAVNPDLVVMYYGLSPLLAPYYDLHSLDDMVYCPRDYDVEGNRRLTLASLLGESAMPVSSSTGYDWASAPDLWFDSVASGVPGSLLPFGPDEANGNPSRRSIALFNALGAVARPGSRFTAQTLDGHPHGGHRALTTASWRRIEDGETTLLALRSGTKVPEAEFTGRWVASRFGKPLTQCLHWGLVPCEPGQILLKGLQGTWNVVTHKLGGQTETRPLPAGPEGLTLGFADEASLEGVEWLELIQQ